jgi:arylsulfatase A
VELVEKYARKPGAGDKQNNPHLAAQLESIDSGVGQILQKLEQLGLAENTIVIFTSDNGGEDRVTINGLLRAGKSTLYEGGVRVPLIVRWPGKVPGNSVCQTPVMTMDFYPTFLEAAGIKAGGKQKIDGLSLVPLLRDPSAEWKRDALYWHYPLTKPHFLGGTSSGAIRKGDYKLIEDFTSGRVELYHLKDDPRELNELSARMPALAGELQVQLRAWRQEVGAKVVKHQ